MIVYLALGIGIVGILVLGYATRQGRFLPFYSSLLGVIALVYVLFGVMTGRSTVMVAKSVVAARFIGAAILGVRWQRGYAGSLLIAIGLIAHGTFDLAHNAMIENTAAPAWWPPYCGTVDVLLGLWLIGLTWQGRVISPEYQPPDITDGG